MWYPRLSSPSLHPSFLLSFLQLGSNNLNPFLGGEGLGALDWSTNSSVNDQLWEDTNGTGNTEEDSVVVGLSQTVVLEQDTRVLRRVSYGKAIIWKGL